MHEEIPTATRPRAGRPRFVPACAALTLAFLFAPGCGDDESPVKSTPTPTATPGESAVEKTVEKPLDEPTSQPRANPSRDPDSQSRRYKPSDGKSDEYGPLPDKVGEWHVSKGAAAGYVDDMACKECHESLYDSFQSVGMSHSLYPLTAATEVEDFGKEFFQETTGDHYVMRKRRGKYYQSRWRVDAEGNKYAEYEMEVSWVIGSGNHVRTYLTQSEIGEMWELPLSWYAEGGWQMSPSFESKGHKGFERIIQRECLFCHNAYPEEPLGKDAPGAWATFPQKLPHGIGCQRCHGPGARHVEIAYREDAKDEDVRARIVNPADLEQRQREEVCMTCHLQPDVANGLNSVQPKFDRPTYSQRPDQDLMDHQIYFDCGTTEDRAARIEVNHHAYRLRKSKCYIESPGKLDCVTCHDPHRKVPEREQAAFYRGKCVKCHKIDECRMEGMGKTLDPAQADCVSCHMVKARPRDVIHVVMTDHLIRREAPAKPLTATRTTPSIFEGPLDVDPLFPERAPKGDMLHIYADIARGLRFDESRAAALVAAIGRANPDAPAAYSKVGEALDAVGERDGAIKVLRDGLARFPEDIGIQSALAWSLVVNGLHGPALEFIDKVLQKQRSPRILQLKASALAYLKKPAEALVAIEEALELRPNQATAWRQYGLLLTQANRAADAMVALRKAIARNPDDASSYLLLADILGGQGNRINAIQILEQAAPRVPDLNLELITLFLFAEPGRRNPERAMRLAETQAKTRPQNARAQLYLAFTGALLRKPDTNPAALQRARTLGADPASCTGTELLLAAMKQDRPRIQKLAKQFQQELQKPTPERLRRHVFGVIQSMLRR